MNKLTSKMDKVKLTYGYVKFTAEDENDEYEFVCIELMNEWFDEFRTINNMLADMEVERYNGLVVVNYLPKSMHYVFNVLNHHLTLAHGIKIKLVDDQIMFLHLICKLADKEMINRIFEDTELELDLETWKKLVDEQIDAKNCFEEKMKLGIYRKIYQSQKPKMNIKFLEFYGLPWFNHNNKHKIYVHYKFAKYDTMCNMYPTQHRVFDETNEIFYKIMILGGKGVLFCPEGFRDYEHKVSSWQSDYDYITRESDSVNESDDEDREALSVDLDDIVLGLESNSANESEDDGQEASLDELDDFMRELGETPQNSAVKSDRSNVSFSSSSFDDDLLSEPPSSDFETDEDEDTPQLKRECIDGIKYYNYIVDTVDVHIDKKVVSMKLIWTSRKPLWLIEARYR
uniref:Uncharacterized protein n=1 Tax=viral metagenome TaxID=1070528 RepID=A0A6C0C7E0_9ZZZZ